MAAPARPSSSSPKAHHGLATGQEEAHGSNPPAPGRGQGEAGLESSGVGFSWNEPRTSGVQQPGWIEAPGVGELPGAAVKCTLVMGDENYDEVPPGGVDPETARLEPATSVLSLARSAT
mgnify:CR=1 FL=1